MARSNSNADNYKVKMSLTRLSSTSKSQEDELLDLCNLSGVTLDPDVFKIVMDLIKMNVQPTALVQMLKKMTATSKGYRADTSRNSIGDDVASKSGSTKPDKNGSEPGTKPERRERSQPLTRREKELKSYAVHK